MSGSANSGIAMVGSGTWPTEAHLPALKRLGSTAPRLQAVYSRSEKRAQEFADRVFDLLQSRPEIYHEGNESRNLDALLARPDITAVIIAVPIMVQPAIILRALAAGKHVLSEKPVAPSVAIGLQLIAKYEREYKPKGLIWRVAENCEVEPGYKTAAQAIRAGKIGNVTFFSLRDIMHVGRDSIWYNTPWRTVPEYQGGFLLDAGVHSVAALRGILPSPMAHLTGIASSKLKWLVPQDTLHAVIRCADGSHGTFELSFAAPTESRMSVANGIVITGTNGYLTVDQIDTVDPVSGEEKVLYRIVVKYVTRNVDGEAGPEREDVIDEPERGVDLELTNFFVAALDGKDDGLGNPRSALWDVAIIEAGLKSGGALVDLGKLVEVEST